MIDPNLVTGNVVRHGEPTVGTLSGVITLQQNRGRLVVTDENRVERTIVDIKGLTTASADGKYKNRVGQASNDNRDGIWTAPPAGDLRNDGI